MSVNAKQVLLSAYNDCESDDLVIVIRRKLNSSEERMQFNTYSESFLDERLGMLEIAKINMSEGWSD